jgi:Zn-dependent peptidase ImmA (M78 family)/transcriptional regulator with XRE-family HTH domain
MPPNPDMLRLGRQRRGFPQTEAARLLGLDQSLLSKFENGLIDIRDELIYKASATYDLPVTFFSIRDTVYGAPISVHPMWRKKADVTAREMDTVIAELNVRIMHLRRLFEGAIISNTNDMPLMDIEDYGSPVRIAAMARAHWKIPSGIIKNLTLIIEKAGAIIVHSSMGGSSICGVRFSVPGMPPLIMLNSAQPADRMRFSLAHELGHLIMHRFPTPNMEQEANQFAVAFLMPDDDMSRYFIGRKIDLSLLASLKQELHVSMSSLLMRAHALKFITENQSTYLWKQMSARGYRLREPPELDFEHEKPEILDRVIRLHLDALGYSTSELAKFLCVHERELHEMYMIGDGGPAKKERINILK